MLSLANIYTLYFRLYFRLCICLNKLSINQSIICILSMDNGLLIISYILFDVIILFCLFIKLIIYVYIIIYIKGIHCWYYIHLYD